MEPNIFKHISADVSPQAKIGRGTKIWHQSQIMAGAQIGENCIIGHNVLVADGAILGNNVKIQSNTDVWNGVELHDYVFVGPSVVFTNDLNPRAQFPKEKSDYKKTVVKRGATIGANATIICDHTLGMSSFIGAGSTVTEDVPDYALVVGNPAKIIGWICECGEKIFKDAAISADECQQCHCRYKRQSNAIVKKI